MTDVETAIRAAFAGGAQEIVLRVSRYGADLKTPECFQAVVRPRDGTKPWTAGVLADPIAALREAMRKTGGNDDGGVFG